MFYACKIFGVTFFKDRPIPAFFNLFSSFSYNLGASWIRTRIIGVEGERECWPLDHHHGPFRVTLTHLSSSSSSLNFKLVHEDGVSQATRFVIVIMIVFFVLKRAIKISSLSTWTGARPWVFIFEGNCLFNNLWYCVNRDRAFQASSWHYISSLIQSGKRPFLILV